MRTKLAAFGAALGLAAVTLAPTASHAAWVRLDYSGTVRSYFGLPILEDDFPLGTPFSATLTFNDDFRQLNVGDLYLGLSREVWGSMQLGSSTYAFSQMELSQYDYGNTSNGVGSYGFRVLGSGPDTDDGEIFGGLLISMLPDITATNAVATVFGDGSFQVASNGFAVVLSYADLTPTEAPPLRVPAPATATLALLGLAGLAVQRQRRPR